jgi:hypothetical protein
MLQSLDAFLIVEKGLPYPKGEVLPLAGGKKTLGRDSKEYQNDISFSSPYVSRRHAVIEDRDGEFLLTSLPGTRHGTTLNDKPLEPGAPCSLSANDRIRLAGEEVLLVFATSALSSQTWDLPVPQPAPVLTLAAERREVTLDGRSLALTGRPYDLLRMLYENRGAAVSNRDLKRAAWPERGLGVDGEPLVTDEELSTLVYRLRQSLEPHGDLIRNLRGYGYMLDLPR